MGFLKKKENKPELKIEIEPKTAQWIDDGWGSYIKLCSHCKCSPLAEPNSGDPCYSPYCPNCGRQMVNYLKLRN